MLFAQSIKKFVVKYCAYIIWPLDSIVSQMSPIHTTISGSLRSVLILSSHLRLGLSTILFPSAFLIYILYRLLISFVRPTTHANLNSNKYPSSRDRLVGIAAGYGLDNREVGVRVPVGSRIFTYPCRPDKLWDSPNLLCNGYRGLFPGGKAAGAWSWPLTSN
jgi:hypothetical protein